MFKELHFRYDTRINLIQKDSFEGLMIQNLWLQSLHITDIDRDAFVGLEDNLTHLHLGDNHIANIHRASIVKTTKFTVSWSPQQPDGFCAYIWR